MGRRLKTKEELRADLKLFETAWKHEMAQVMRNAVARMVAGGSGRRIPAQYKTKLPRFTRTVVESTPNPRAEPNLMPGPHARMLRPTREKPRAPREQRPANAAENHELRRSLDNAIKRMRAFRDGRPLPARYEMTFPESPDGATIREAQRFLASARLAQERLLDGLREV